jgi:hypothetical protein
VAVTRYFDPNVGLLGGVELNVIGFGWLGGLVGGLVGPFVGCVVGADDVGEDGWDDDGWEGSDEVGLLGPPTGGAESFDVGVAPGPVDCVGVDGREESSALGP